MNKSILIFVLILTGCVATGIQVKESQLSQFKEGRTTMQEVITALGKPNHYQRNSDGTRMIMYFYMGTSVRPETYIPYVGGFIGGADTVTNTVTLSFDINEVLLSYSAIQSTYGTGFGGSSGMPVDNRTDQPKQIK